MAPRGRRRPRRVGLRRMDAALDAMLPMGFPVDLVRKTVKELLKVYGGDDGWAFIEDASYKVLIDTILEQQEQCEPEIRLLKDETSQEELGIQVHSPEIHCAQVLPLPPVNDIPCKDDTWQEELAVHVHSPHVHPVQVHSPRSRSPPPLDVIPYLMKEESSPDKFGVQVQNSSIHSTIPVDHLPTRRRKRCYGWISSDDEEPT